MCPDHNERSRPFRIALIAGARPNFVKIAALYHAFTLRRECRPMIVHTGQHYSHNLSAVFFSELGLPDPDIHLDVGSGTHGEQTARALVGIERFLIEQTPDFVICVGDVNSTLAAALASAKCNIPCGHVEAGLRSGDRTMPEEVNRIVADHTAAWLYTTCEDASVNLRAEGIPEERIIFAGNVMIDTLMAQMPRIKASDAPERLGLTRKQYMVMTMHRPASVDDAGQRARLVAILKQVTARFPVVFPMHPRTRNRFACVDGEMKRLVAGGVLVLCEPLGYVDFLALQMSAHAVLTDSGGIQEETTALGVPCLTLRPNTERPVTITEGTNVLVDLDAGGVIDALEAVHHDGGQPRRLPRFWDGRAAERIAAHVLDEVLAIARTHSARQHLQKGSPARTFPHQTKRHSQGAVLSPI